MRETLLARPEMFQIFNGGIVCTASSVDVKNEDGEQWVNVAFDQDQLQGVVNGGHTYGTTLHVIHDNPIYAEGMPLKTVLAKKDKGADNPALAPLLEDDDKLADRIAVAREKAQVQIKVVAPVSDSDFLHDIARARNLSQSVDQTALQNLAGKYDLMKEVLRDAPAPFGPLFVERVVWKTNQEVPEDSTEIPVKVLIHIMALMNTRLYTPGVKVANEVYTRSGLVVREFGEAEGEDSAFYDKLARLLPEFIKLYDHIYLTLPETDPAFPWADGKPPSVAKGGRLSARRCSRARAVPRCRARSPSGRCSRHFGCCWKTPVTAYCSRQIRSGSSTRRGRNWHPPSRRRSRIRGASRNRWARPPMRGFGWKARSRWR